MLLIVYISTILSFGIRLHWKMDWEYLFWLMLTEFALYFPFAVLQIVCYHYG